MAFKALLLEEADGKVTSKITDLEEGQLPDGDVLVRVTHSSLNYKDGMILMGLGRLVRTYPHVPGVDMAGVVEESASPGFKAGDEVLLTGYRYGEVWWGGYAEKTRVPADWLVRMPKGLTAERAMAIGTAGFTSMQSVIALEAHGLEPSKGTVLVTGATGGLGSVAVAILANLGYTVAASTGKADTHDYLKDLGAAQIVDRAELASAPERPMLTSRWAGCIDSVGGDTLAHVLAEMDYGASIAACGLAGGNKLATTVVPFLLRAVNLLGIDSVQCPRPLREEVWRRVTGDLPMDKLDKAIVRARLEDLPKLAGTILKGGVKGRTVVEIG